jgi:F-type H+-transporting ATPase subunit alpha
MPVEQQVLVLYVLTQKYFSNVNVENTSGVERAFIKFMTENYNTILEEIRAKHEITDELEPKLKAAIEDFMKTQ